MGGWRLWFQVWRLQCSLSLVMERGWVIFCLSLRRKQNFAWEFAKSTRKSNRSNPTNKIEFCWVVHRNFLCKHCQRTPKFWKRDPRKKFRSNCGRSKTNLETIAVQVWYPSHQPLSPNQNWYGYISNASNTNNLLGLEWAICFLQKWWLCQPKTIKYEPCIHWYVSLGCSSQPNAMAPLPRSLKIQRYRKEHCFNKPLGIIYAQMAICPRCDRMHDRSTCKYSHFWLGS